MRSHLQQKSIIYACFLLSIVSLLASCSKKENCCTVLQMNVDLDVRGTADKSIFEATTTPFVTKEQVKIYYMGTDGRYNLFHQANLDASEGFLLNKASAESAQYILRVFVSDKVNADNMSYTLVQYGSIRTDTIQAQIKDLQIQKAWLNNTAIDQTGGKPTIIKL